MESFFQASCKAVGRVCHAPLVVNLFAAVLSISRAQMARRDASTLEDHLFMDGANEVMESRVSDLRL